MLYKVTFSYTYDIEAVDNQEAENKAIEKFDEQAPRSEEMNIETSWDKDLH